MDENPTSLFRAQALEAKRPRAYGRVILAVPLSIGVFTALSVLMGIAIICCLIFGSYTRRETVTGQLVPVGGVVEVRVTQTGTVLEKLVTEGANVEKGQVLYIVSGEVFSSSIGTNSTIRSQLSVQERSLHKQIDHVRSLQVSERQSLSKQISAIVVEKAKVDAVIETLRARLELTNQSVERQKKIAAQGIISQEAFANTQGTQLEGIARLQGYERDQARFVRESSDAEDRLASLDARYESQIEELDRELASIRRNVAEVDVRRRVEVRAPAKGIATAVNAEVGQVVDVSIRMVSIIPEDAVFEARLLAPTRAIGFVRQGDAVLVRYNAYPYQRFGAHHGIVRSITRMVIPGASLAESATKGHAEPLYEITVVLESQTVVAYGENRSLQSGMTLEAEVLQETRRLYEWILEPLYSISGKLRA